MGWGRLVASCVRKDAMAHFAAPSARRPRHRGPATALALAGALALCSCAAAVSLGGCGATPRAAPAPGASPQALASSPAGGPSPVAVVTAGPVPRAAVRAATRFWRLLDAHRDTALLGVLARDSPAAAAVRAGRANAFWGIARARVTSVADTVGRTPPIGATLEFAMTVDLTPALASPWAAGSDRVVMSLRRVGGAWLVYEIGTGP